MADKTVSVSLTGKDQLSPVFKRVADSAMAAGRTIDNAGKSVDTFDREAISAAQSMSRFEQATAKAEQVTGRLGISATKVGAMLGTAVTGGLLLAVHAAAQAEVSQQRLQTTIEATGALFEQYAGQIDAVNNRALSLSFDDEDAQDALSSLIQATGDVQASMDQMGLAMDIARGRGIDLAAASKIVIAADQGRFTALKRLGIQIDENSTKESVLADLQARYAGQAEAYANTNAGAFDRWQNAAENAAESVGAFLGPAQQLLLIFPGLAAGATALTGAMAGLGGSTGALGLVAATLTGPAGIIVAAGLAGVAIKEFTGGLGPAFHQASDDAIASVDALIQKVVELGDTSALANTVLGLDTISASQKQINDAANEGIGIIGAWIAEAQAMDDGNADTVEGLQLASAEFDGYSQHVLDAIDANKDGTATLQELTDAQAQFNDEAQNSQRVLDGLKAGSDELAKIFVMTGEGAADAKAKANEYTDALLHGKLSAEDYELGLQQLISDYGEIRENALQSGDAIDDNTTAVESNTDAVIKWLDAGGRVHTLSDDIAKSMQQMGTESVTLGSNLTHTFDQFELRAINSLDHVATQMAQMGALSPKMGMPGDTGAFDQQIDKTKASANQAKAAQDGLARGITNAANAMTYQVGESQRLAGEMDTWRDHVADAQAAVSDAFNNVQTAVTGTTKALESGFRVAVSNTNAIADSAQGVQDWADELIGAQGVQSEMDDLLQRGIVTQQQYNDAQAAYTPIAEANKRIQDDVLAIQVAQAPVQAALMQQQADYLDSVKAMNPEMQTFTLAMMDNATATEALNLATSLLGENGDVFKPMVASAASLDPYLASILEQMGLISVETDSVTGEKTVTFTMDDQASSPMADLSASIHDLADQVYILTTYLDDDATNDGISQLDQQLADLDSFVATPTVNLNDNASGGLANIAGLLGGLYDKTITVTTINQTLNPFENGGTVRQMASGGTVSPYGYSRAAKNGLTATLVGERGPEVLMLPGGAQVMNTEGSRERWGGDGIHVSVTVQGNVYGIDDLAEEVSKPIVAAIRQSAARQRQSVGARR